MDDRSLFMYRLDYLGRIAVPQEIREALEWQHGDRMEFSIGDERDRSVIIRPVRRHCSFCHCDDEFDPLTAIRYGYICDSCKEEFQELLAAALD